MPASFRSLTGAYAELPNRFYSSPELASLRPEITCRDANGNGYGGSSTTQFTLSTALPAAVGANQLANRGDGTGFYIRVIQQGTTGLIGEQPIVSNTVGTTPVITVAGSLGFTPAAGDKYEILSGRVFLMATAASMWKWYDVATNSFSAALTTTNLTIPAIDNEIIVLDEQYTPLGNLPSTGFFGNLTATGATNITNTTLTGTSAGADANLQANEYANFQVRIISDGTNPTAVGQRKKITSHTAANPTVYTLSGVWGVAPSNTAQYVIEGVGDIICMTGSASALAHTYAAGGFRAHSISADPLFTNAGGITAADYKWPLTSPLLGAGATIGSFSTDYFGTARPQGAAWDIGIYEAISSALKLAIGFPGSFWSAFP